MNEVTVKQIRKVQLEFSKLLEMIGNEEVTDQETQSKEPTNVVAITKKADTKVDEPVDTIVTDTEYDHQDIDRLILEAMRLSNSQGDNHDMRYFKGTGRSTKHLAQEEYAQIVERCEQYIGGKQ